LFYDLKILDASNIEKLAQNGFFSKVSVYILHIIACSMRLENAFGKTENLVTFSGKVQHYTLSKLATFEGKIFFQKIKILTYHENVHIFLNSRTAEFLICCEF
jgi:hypothetical protein